jgi:hypothetical protein
MFIISPDLLRTGDRIPVEAKISANVQTGPGAHSAFYTTGNGSLCRGAELLRRAPSLQKRLELGFHGMFYGEGYLYSIALLPAQFHVKKFDYRSQYSLCKFYATRTTFDYSKTSKFVLQ